MSLDTYETHDLIEVISTVKPDVSQYWSQFFPNELTSTNQYINFDEVQSGPRALAPFVSPLVQGRVQKDRGYSTKRFEPAYVKPKDIVDSTKLIKRRAGEALLGSLNPQQRRDALMAQYMLEHRQKIDRRIEWMCAQAVIEGAYTVVGEDYPSVLVSFNRPAGQTITLTGTSLWTDTANSDPLTNLQTWCQLIHNTYGYVVDRVTAGGTAATAFIQHPKVKDQLDTNYAGISALLNRGPRLDNNAKPIGMVNGLEIWVYSDVYDADDGTVTQMMAQDTVVLTASAGIDGVQCFGAIMDKRAGYQPLRYFPKNWDQEDPSVEYVMTQSAPLMVPRRTASLKAKVV